MVILRICPKKVNFHTLPSSLSLFHITRALIEILISSLTVIINMADMCSQGWWNDVICDRQPGLSLDVGPVPTAN
jgi:hypothetical protein